MYGVHRLRWQSFRRLLRGGLRKSESLSIVGHTRYKIKNSRQCLRDFFCRRIRGSGQSNQAIKLFQITPCVSDFQTLNNPGSWQPVGPSKNQFYLPFLIQFFHPRWCETCRVIQQQFWMEECDILGVKTHDPSYVFSAGKDPNPPRL